VLERAGFEIAAVAADAIELTRRVRAARPDLVVADIRMPPGLADDGLRAVLELRAERSDLPVIVLSQHVQRQYVTELLEAGGSGSGYVLKQRVADVDAFVDDVRRVHGGATILDPVVVATMMNRPRPGEDRLHALTTRQREVLALMAEGRSNAAIADALVITGGAVAKHVSNIFAKINLPDLGSDNRRVLAVLTWLKAR
jgi:DNA-binding NarL/FixJ family response regulator